MSNPLRAYWWNKDPNFGDVLSRDVLQYVSGRTVTWAPEAEAEIFSVGSIMWHVRKGVTRRGADQAPPVVWGSGCMEPINTDWCSNAHICALRGPVTAAVLDQDPLPLGDPGILASQIFGEVERTDAIGVLLHHSQINEETLARLAALNEPIKIIDVRSYDAGAVIREIASCRHIFSQSLHGLIVADSYGIPNTRIEGKTIHRSANFKFYDYAASIGRSPMVAVTLDDLASAVQAAKMTPHAELPYINQLREAADALVETFPSSLKSTSIRSAHAAQAIETSEA